MNKPKIRKLYKEIESLRKKIDKISVEETGHPIDNSFNNLFKALKNSAETIEDNL